MASSASLLTSRALIATMATVFAAQRAKRSAGHNNVKYDRSHAIPIAISFLFRPIFLNSSSQAQRVLLAGRGHFATKRRITTSGETPKVGGHSTASKTPWSSTPSRHSAASLKPKLCPLNCCATWGRISLRQHVEVFLVHNADQLKRGLSDQVHGVGFSCHR